MLTRKMIVGMLIAVLLWWVGSAQPVYWGAEDETGDAGPFRVASIAAVPAYEPGELIVKFKEPVAEALEQQLSEGKAGGRLKLSPSLDRLAGKYKVKKVDPIIKNFKAKRQRIQNLKTKDKAGLTKKEKHLLRRLNRAPQGARVPDLGRIYKLELAPGQLAALAVAEYETDPDVEYAELNYYYQLAKTPDDPNYSPEQWALNNTGQSYPVHNCGTSSGTAGCDINAPEAWDIRTDSSEVIVAVIDSGVDYNHADLSANMWTDTDGSHGYDFYYSDKEPTDEFGHGTHCAGIIAADGNNAVDITGVCWSAKIMAVKVSAGASFPTILPIMAIEYAVDKGADVLSNSWGGGYNSNALKDVIDYAYSQGVIIVAAAGNTYGTSPVYPAYYDEVIAVAATDSDDNMAVFSTHGDWIDVAAPGKDILSLRAPGTDMYYDPLRNPTYNAGAAFYPCYDSNATMYIASGTSMACPHVAALAALCLAEDPNLKAEDVRLLIKLNAHDVSNPDLGAGRIDAYSTLNAIPPNFPDPNQATEPDPCDDANLVSINTYLSWTPDEMASSHDVYLGTSFSDVNDADTSSAVFQGNVVAPWFDPAGLDQNTTYYWRIDERNYNACTKGAVWSFVTRDGSIIYVDVDANDGGDGMSWSTAFNCLEDAFDIAVNDEIWVAEGTYAPNTTSHLVSFAPPENTKLYGGFAAVESSRGQRDANLAVNVTILSGNINDPNDPTDNCNHVLVGRSGLVLDRFTITGGYGGGRTQGGGMYNRHVSAVTVSDCTFTDNTSGYDGGAIYNDTVNRLTLTNCRLIENTSEWAGGICSVLSVVTASNCVFSKNDGSLLGGAVHEEGVFSTYSNCIFTENTSNYGGALFQRGGGTHIVQNCTLTKNHAETEGGALCISGLLTPEKVENCILWSNDAGVDANEIDIIESAITFSYCDIKGCGGSDNWDPNFGTDGGGNIDQDPCFVDADANDFHLAPDSPCINAGDPNGDYSGQTDIDGEPRVVGSRVDIGADETPYRVYSVDKVKWYVTIQAAIDDASAGEEIVASEGTYYEMVDFKGKAITVRSCNTDDPCVVAATVIDANSSGTVVTFNSSEGSSSVLSGFTITGGYKTSGNGAGIYCSSASPTISNCVITDNSCVHYDSRGGGIYCSSASPTISGCTIKNNFGHRWGGGLYAGGGSPTVSNCTFSGNTTDHFGAGMYASGDATVSNCTFSGNDAGDYGGGFYNNYTGANVTNCTFSDNEAFVGGGVYSIDSASPSMTISNCVFSDNASEYCGGGVYFDMSSGTILNSVFSGNISTGYGGYGAAVTVEGSSALTKVGNCTFYGNWAANSAGGISISGGAAFVTNSIFRGNEADECEQIYVYCPTYEVKFRNCCIQGGLPSSECAGPCDIDDGNNINCDPCFVNPAAGNFHLASSSCCIDKGDPYGDYRGQTDIDGEARYQGECVDIGADEYTKGLVQNVQKNNWYWGINPAIDEADANDEIVVNPWTYYENVDFDGNAITVRSRHPNSFNVVAGTIIDGNGSGNVVTFNHGEGPGSVLRGFTITNGNRGIYCYGASPTIADCNICGNTSTGYDDGAGMSIDNYASPSVADCIFYKNATDYWGGGMYIHDSTPDVVNCVFVDSLADYGGGMAIYDCSPRVINCVFYQNEADYDGGGLYIENEDALPEIINCTFFGNHTEDDGGGMFCYDLATVYITNCIFWSNTADGSGGEIYNEDCDVYVDHCDIEGGVNGDKCGGDSLEDEGGNEEDDPEFADEDDPDGADGVWGTCDDGLVPTCDCDVIDDGDNDAVPEDIDTDIKGSDRIINDDVDMGAYEYDEECED